MDLGTIRNRLNQRFYTSAKECLEDLNTMFVNCYVFNMPGTVSKVYSTVFLTFHIHFFSYERNFGGAS